MKTDGRSSRQWPVFQRLASWLAQRDVSPNAISLSSIAFAQPPALAFVLTAWTESDVLRRVLWLAGGVCVQLRTVRIYWTVWWPSKEAKIGRGRTLQRGRPRRRHGHTARAGYAEGGEPMPALCSISAVFTAYVRALGASTGVGQVFLGPMAKQQRMALVTAVALYCTTRPRRGKGFDR